MDPCKMQEARQNACVNIAPCRSDRAHRTRDNHLVLRWRNAGRNVQNIPPISISILRAQRLALRITAGRSDPRPGVTPGVAEGTEEGVAPARSAVSRLAPAARETRPMRARMSLRFKHFSRQLASGDLSTKLSTGGRRSSPRVASTAASTRRAGRSSVRGSSRRFEEGCV